MNTTATKSSGIAKEIPGSNRNGKLRKEEEKVPLVEIFKRMKRKRASENEGSKVYKKRKMMRPLLIMEKTIPLPDFYKMSRKTKAYSIEDDDTDITVMADFYKMSRKGRAYWMEDEDDDADIAVIADFYKMIRKRAKSIEDKDDGNITVIADFYKMSPKRAHEVEEEDDGDITVMEFYKKIKRMQSRRRRPMSAKKKILLRTPISRKDKEEEEIIEMSSSFPVSKKEMEIIEMSSSSPIPKKGKGDEIVEMNSSSALDERQSCFHGAGKIFDPSSEEDSEEEKKHVRRSPILVKRFSDRIILESSEIEESEPESESEEELLRECDRHEIDHGYNYVLKKRFRALTNFKNPEKIYYKRGTYYPIDHVLHDPKYPLATLTKLALKTYNDIQGTQYEFVGFVKAYRRFTGAACYWIRFKARVLGQDAINFQTFTIEEIPDRKTNVVTVRVESVFPLPPC